MQNHQQLWAILQTTACKCHFSHKLTHSCTHILVYICIYLSMLTLFEGGFRLQWKWIISVVFNCNAIFRLHMLSMLQVTNNNQFVNFASWCIFYIRLKGVFKPILFSEMSWKSKTVFFLLLEWLQQQTHANAAPKYWRHELGIFTKLGYSTIMKQSW